MEWGILNPELYMGLITSYSLIYVGRNNKYANLDFVYITTRRNNLVLYG